MAEASQPDATASGTTLESVLKIFPILSAIAAGAWIVLTYVEGLNDEARTRRDQAEREMTARAEQAQRDVVARVFEARKPFLTLQLERYEETAKIAGLLAVPDGTDAWVKSFHRFEQLFWAELTMVEDPEVSSAMSHFRADLTPMQEAMSTRAWTPAETKALRDDSLALARAINLSIKRSWTVEIDAPDRKNPK